MMTYNMGGSSSSGGVSSASFRYYVGTLLLLGIVFWLQYDVLYHVVMVSIPNLMHTLSEEHSQVTSLEMKLHSDIVKVMEYQHDAELHLNQSHKYHTRYVELEDLIEYHTSLEVEYHQHAQEDFNASINVEEKLANDYKQKYENYEHLHQVNELAASKLANKSHVENVTATKFMKQSMALHNESMVDMNMVVDVDLKHANEELSIFDSNDQHEDKEDDCGDSRIWDYVLCVYEGWKLKLSHSKYDEEEQQHLKDAMYWNTHATMDLHNSIMKAQAAQYLHSQSIQLSHQSMVDQNESLYARNVSQYYQVLSTKMYNEMIRHETKYKKLYDLATYEEEESQMEHDQIEQMKVQLQSNYTKYVKLKEQSQKEIDHVKFLRRDIIKQQQQINTMKDQIQFETNQYRSDVQYACYLSLVILAMSVLIVIRIYKYNFSSSSSNSEFAVTGNKQATNATSCALLRRVLQTVSNWLICSAQPHTSHQVQQQEQLKARRDVGYLICHGWLLVVVLIIFMMTLSSVITTTDKTDPDSHWLLRDAVTIMIPLSVLGGCVQALLLHFTVPYVPVTAIALYKSCVEYSSHHRRQQQWWREGRQVGADNDSDSGTTESSGVSEICSRWMDSFKYPILSFISTISHHGTWACSHGFMMTIQRFLQLTALFILELLCAMCLMGALPHVATSMMMQVSSIALREKSWLLVWLIGVVMLSSYIYYGWTTVALILREMDSAVEDSGDGDLGRAPSIEDRFDGEGNPQDSEINDPREGRSSAIGSSSSLSSMSWTSRFSNMSSKQSAFNVPGESDAVASSESSPLLAPDNGRPLPSSDSSACSQQIAASQDSVVPSSTSSNNSTEFDTVELRTTTPSSSRNGMTVSLSSLSSNVLLRRLLQMPPRYHIVASWRSEWIKLRVFLDFVVFLWIATNCWPQTISILWHFFPLILRFHGEEKSDEDEKGPTGRASMMLSFLHRNMVVFLVLLVPCLMGILRGVRNRRSNNFESFNSMETEKRHNPRQQRQHPQEHRHLLSMIERRNGGGYECNDASTMHSGSSGGSSDTSTVSWLGCLA